MVGLSDTQSHLARSDLSPVCTPPSTAEALAHEGIWNHHSTKEISCGFHQKHRMAGNWKPKNKNPTPDKNCVTGLNSSRAPSGGQHLP